MKKYLAIILCFVFAFCAGCSADDSSLTEDPSSAEPENEAEEAADEAEQGDIVYDVNNLSQEQKNMIYPMDIVTYTGMPESLDDVWDVVFAMLCDTYYDYFLAEENGIAVYESPGIKVPESLIKELFSVFWEDFDGELPPYPTDYLEGTTYDNSYKEGDIYAFAQGERGEGSMYSLVITSWIQHADGSYTVEARQEWIEDALYPGPGASYRFQLTENEYTKDLADPLFAYTITDVEGADGYILPDSDSRYYTEDELKDLSQEDLRYARNEIYARHGYIFKSEDLWSYFWKRSWYEGTVDSEDFDDSVFNEYEEANLRTIESLEQGE